MFATMTRRITGDGIFFFLISNNALLKMQLKCSPGTQAVY